MSTNGLVSVVVPNPICVLFIDLGVDFVHTIQADAHILPKIDKLDELLYRAIELSDDNILFR